nr:hypothetical protein [Candidatus Freyarchaeota archaeon]
MSLKELFPVYPLRLRSPPKSRIKFGTRRLYVDLPWQSYYFLQLAMDKAIETGLSTGDVREEWDKYLQNNEDSLFFHGKPLVTVSLRSLSFSEKIFLRLDVKWDLFIEYLEEKAEGFLSEIEKNGENILKVYREIWTNFFGVTGIIIPPKPIYFPSSRYRFRKLLKRIGDYSYIVRLLDLLEGIMKQIEEVIKRKIPSIELYIVNFIMDIQHLRALIDIIDISAAYLLLRNLLENFVKLFIYLDIGISINPDFVLYSMFIYEYETENENSVKFEPTRRPVYSYKKFKDESIRKFLKIISTLNLDEGIDLLELINKLGEKHIPILRVNPKVMEDFCDDYSLNINLNKLYSACSAIIHNQPPLPFFSLLEVKFFKNFLEKYIQSIQVMAEKIINIEIKSEKIHISPVLNATQSLKKCLQVADFLERKYDAEIKDAIKSALITLQKEKPDIWIEPLTLISIFHLLSPSFKDLRNFSFIDRDLEDIVEHLSPILFKFNIRDEVFETLRGFQDMLLPMLENYTVFSSIKSLEQKKKVIFYLLLYYLPRIAIEIMKN